MFSLILTSAVTLPVIAFLVIVIAAQAYLNALRTKARLNAQAAKLGKITAGLLSAAVMLHKRDTERQIGRAIEATFDAMKDIGFDKLASGEVAFEGIMFGGTPFDPELSRRRRPLRDDPFAILSLDELREALRGEPRPNGSKPGTEPRSFDTKTTGTEEGGAPLHEGNGGQKGPRPYHRTADIDSGGRSPRAG